MGARSTRLAPVPGALHNDPVGARMRAIRGRLGVVGCSAFDDREFAQHAADDVGFLLDAVDKRHDEEVGQLRLALSDLEAAFTALKKDHAELDKRLENARAALDGETVD